VTRVSGTAVTRIVKINALRRRAPHSWPRPRDITSKTRTPAASEADGRAPFSYPTN
jgi:hypothetical protein